MAPDSRLFSALARVAGETGRLDAILHVGDLIRSSTLGLDTVCLLAGLGSTCLPTLLPSLAHAL